MPALIDLVAEQCNVLTAIGLEAEARRLDAAGARLRHNTFRVLVIGEFSRGKSMLINALLEKNLLATSLLRLPVINVVRGGAKPAARAGRAGGLPDGLPDGLKDIALDAIPRSEDATQVELTWDAPFLQDGLEIIEYPSMSEAPDGDLFRATVESADLIVVVVACDSLYSRVEADMIESVVYTAGHRKPLFVASFVDRLALKDLDTVKRAALVRLPVNQDRIFFVSAQNALDGVPNAVADIASLRDKIAAEAMSREALKTVRVRQLVADSLEAASARLVAAAKNSGDQQEQSATQINAVHGAFRELQDLHNRTQRDLIEIRKGTRDVLQGQIGTFVSGLALKIDEWGRAYEGSDLVEHLNRKLKDAMREFNQQDFGKYLQTRLKEQEDLLTTGLTRYRQQLGKLYDLLPENQPEVQMVLGPLRVPANLGEVNLVKGERPDLTAPGIFTFRSLVAAPGAMLTLVGTLVGSIVFAQRALILLPTGIAVTAYLVSRQFRTRSVSDRLKTYAAQIRDQAARLEMEVIHQINAEIDTLHAQVTQLLKSSTQTAQSAVQARIINLQAGMKAPDDVARTRLERIRAALSAIN